MVLNSNSSNSAINIPNFKELELPVDVLKAHMIDLVSMMPIDPKVQEKLINNINAISDKPTTKQKNDLEKAALVLHIMKEFVFDHSAEVAKGAHVMVNDNGALYDRLVEQGVVQERYSSHHNRNKSRSDVSLQGGEIFREFLVGKTKDGRTWFQLEGHSTGGVKNAMGHLVDYVYYKSTGKNVGQYGLSRHVDSNPINIDIKDIKDRMAQHVNPQAASSVTNKSKKAV